MKKIIQERAKDNDWMYDPRNEVCDGCSYMWRKTDLKIVSNAYGNDELLCPECKEEMERRLASDSSMR